MNANRISLDVTDEELLHLLNTEIHPCSFCKHTFKLNESRWMFGERYIDDTDWEDTIAFGCPHCESTGPASTDRVTAMRGWNTLVSGATNT